MKIGVAGVRRDSPRSDHSHWTASQSIVNASVPDSASIGASAVERLLVGALVDAEVAEAALGEQALEPRLVPALGQPEAGRLAETAAVRAQAGVELQVCGPARVASIGSTAWVAAEAEQLDPPFRGRLGERRQQVAVERLQALERGPVTSRLGAAGARAAPRHRRIGLAGADPKGRQNSSSRSSTPSASSWSASTGVTVIVSRSATLEIGSVGADHGVEQPFLAERVGAEALDVGHVAVEDDREGSPTGAGSRPADGDEVERPVEVALGLRA